jgi:hypothetical protein
MVTRAVSGFALEQFPARRQQPAIGAESQRGNGVALLLADRAHLVAVPIDERRDAIRMSSRQHGSVIAPCDVGIPPAIGRNGKCEPLVAGRLIPDDDLPLTAGSGDLSVHADVDHGQRGPSLGDRSDVAARPPDHVQALAGLGIPDGRRPVPVGGDHAGSIGGERDARPVVIGR